MEKSKNQEELEKLFKKQFELTGFQLLNLLKNFAGANLDEYLDRDLSKIEHLHLSQECISYLLNEDLMNIIYMMKEDMTQDDLNKLL